MTHKPPTPHDKPARSRAPLPLPPGEGRSEGAVLPHLPWFLAVVYIIIAAAWIAWGLAPLNISRAPTITAGLDNLHQLRPFWILSAALWLILTALWITLAHHKPARSPTLLPLPSGRRVAVETEGRGEGNQSRASKFLPAAFTILLISLAVRVAVLSLHSPSLSDDIWRYLFDGQTSIAGHSPYTLAPAHIDPANPRFPGESVLAARVNNPDLASVYLPVSQSVFAAITFAAQSILGPDFIHDPDRLQLAFRTIFIALDILAILILLLILRARSQSAWWAALYAWHPLPITEIAGSGHQDIIGITLMLIALALLDHPPIPSSLPLPPGVSRGEGVQSWLSTIFPSIAFTLAALVKPIVAPIAILAFRSKPQLRDRRMITAILITILTLALIALLWLFLSRDAGATQSLFTALTTFVARWEFFGSIFVPLQALTHSEILPRALCFAALLTVFILLFRRTYFHPSPESRSGLGEGGRPRPGGGLYFSPSSSTSTFCFAALLLSTTAYPWYLLWALAPLPLALAPPHIAASRTSPPSQNQNLPANIAIALWISSLTISWSYYVLADVPHWHVPAWAIAASYTLVYAALASPLLFRGARRLSRALFAS